MKHSRRIFFDLARSSLVVATACGSADELDDRDGPDAVIHWGYDVEDGPQRWSELSSDFATCGTGEHQSPIDISATLAPEPFSNHTEEYGPTSATITDNGHAIQVDIAEPNNALWLADVRYVLRQFHFHSHSEHTIAGVARALEMHLVHRAEDERLAVVAVFLDPGAPNAGLAPVFDTLPEVSEVPLPLSNGVNPATLLPEPIAGWSYSGSLTTPPCTEGVTWIVYGQPTELSQEQLSALTRLHSDNFRPTARNIGPVRGGN